MTRTVGFFRSLIGRVILVFLAGAFGMAAGQFIFTTTTGMQNNTRLSEMAEQTLLRAERTADYALITISDLIVSYRGGCDMETTRQLGRALYTRGVIKDLRILNSNGEIECSGLVEMPDVPSAQYYPGAGIVGSANNIQFHKMGDGEGGLLGISWALPSGQVFLAVLSVDSLMFDVFPSSLRSGASANLLLSGESIARYIPTSMFVGNSGWHDFTAKSDRFPLSTHLSVDPQVLAAWNREAELYVLGAAGAVGLMLGYLLTLAMARQQDISGVLRDALYRREFVAHIQPIFRLSDRAVVGGEVLARWQKPDGSLVPPTRFISFAEECGLIVPMTWQILDSALDKLNGHLQENQDFKLGVNITPDHLVARDFIEELCAKTQEYGVSRRQIVIEITERQEPGDFVAARARIRELQALGFGISLDDTGAGHNGLSNVQRLSIDTIKIDKHFIDLIGVDKVAAKIVQMLVNLARDLEMGTVAEGIETEDQLIALRECGVDRGQGFLVSPALPADEFLAFVSEKPAAALGKKAA